jgi:hypothetical protein
MDGVWLLEEQGREKWKMQKKGGFCVWMWETKNWRVLFKQPYSCKKIDFDIINSVKLILAKIDYKLK